MIKTTTTTLHQVMPFGKAETKIKVEHVSITDQIIIELAKKPGFSESMCISRAEWETIKSTVEELIK